MVDGNSAAVVDSVGPGPAACAGHLTCMHLICHKGKMVERSPLRGFLPLGGLCPCTLLQQKRMGTCTKCTERLLPKTSWPGQQRAALPLPQCCAELSQPAVLVRRKRWMENSEDGPRTTQKMAQPGLEHICELPQGGPQHCTVKLSKPSCELRFQWWQGQAARTKSKTACP